MEIKKVDSSIEKRILTGMIVSTSYLKEVFSILDLNYFQNSFIKKISKWVKDFYKDYEEAPNEHIQDIFTLESEKLKEEEKELIKAFLVSLSSRYETEESINVPYLVDVTVKYFKKRQLEITANKVLHLLKNDSVDEAEQQVVGFKKVAKTMSSWFNPFADCEMIQTFQEKEEVFFKFPGKLGEFLGAFDKGWLVGVSGAYKKGKTWWLQEFALIGMLSGIKVAFFSLEMPKQSMKERIYKRLIAGTGDGGDFLYPVFDCERNQTGECGKRERTNRIQLVDINGVKPDYHPSNQYRICTACRGTEDFVTEQWWTTKKRPGLDLQVASVYLKPIQDMHNNLLRMKVYPKYSANISTIKRDLVILEETEGFMPGMIVVDHADILSPEQVGLTGVQKEDESWMALSRLASEHHCLVVTGTQVTKDGQDVATLGIRHTGRWAGKLGHVEVMLGINATPQEKDNGIMRISIMEHRYKEFNESDTVTVLQNIQLGQVHLDSE